jgi:hypothetical protein
MMQLVVTFCNFVNMPKNDNKQGKYYGKHSYQEQIFIVYVIVTPSCKWLMGPYVNGWKVEIRGCLASQKVY